MSDRVWWVSWYSAGAFEYDEPWWVSGGEVGGRGRATLVAAVKAPTEDAAEQIIVDAHDDPHPDIEWRFVDERGAGWSPFTERFPRAEWMRWETEAGPDE